MEDRGICSRDCAGCVDRIVAADTDLTPIDIGSYSSRVTFMAGNATMRAAQEVKKQIASAAAKKMNCAPEDLVFRDEGVKITLALSKRSVDFFKQEAAKHNTQYQRMIRRLLDAYAEHHAQPLTSRSTRTRLRRAG